MLGLIIHRLFSVSYISSQVITSSITRTLHITYAGFQMFPMVLYPILPAVSCFYVVIQLFSLLKGSFIMKRKILSIMFAIVYSPILLAAIPPQTTPLPKASPPNHIKNTVFDAHIARNANSTNSDVKLIVKRDDNYSPGHRDAYIGFDLSKYNIGGYIESAELKLHILTTPTDNIDVLLVRDDSFWNTTFSWNNRPETSEVLATFSTKDRDKNGFVTIPLDTKVLNEIQKDGKLSLALKSHTPLIFNAFSSFEAGADLSPKMLINRNAQDVMDSSAIRYLNVVAAREENNFNEVRIAEFDVINSKGQLVNRDNWQVLGGTQTTNWQLMFDGKHETHMRLRDAAPNYVNIDLGEAVDINAVVYTPPKVGYYGRVKDLLVYGSSDNEEWRLIGSRTIPRGNGNAPHIAFTGEQSELQQAQISLPINIRPRVPLEAARLSNSKRTDVTATGLYTTDPTTIALWVTGVQDGDFMELTEGPWAGSKKYRLKEGLNSFNVNQESKDLSLYLHIASNDTGDRDRKAKVRLMGSNVKRYPVFYNGQTTQKDWEDMIAIYPLAKRFDMVGGNMILTILRSHYTPVNMQKLSDAYEEVLIPTELAAGISNNDSNPLHYSDANPYIFLPRDSGYMAKYDDYLAYNKDLTYRMINPTNVRNFWGIWHEVGHTLQTKGLNWSGQGEVSVNIYAFAARVYNTPLSNLTVMYDPEFTKAFNKLTQVSTYSELDRASREMMFHHMFFIFGETVMHDLHQRYRENTHGEMNDLEFEIGATSDEQMNVMAIMASKVTETNLIPLFEFWKFPLTQTTKDTINGYGFPNLQGFDKLPSELVFGRPEEMFDMKF